MLKFMDSNRSIGLLMVFMAVAIAVRPNSGTVRIIGQTSTFLPAIFILALAIGGSILLIRDVSPVVYLVCTLPFLIYCIALVVSIILTNGPLTAIVVYGFAYTVSLCKFFAALDNQEWQCDDPRTGEGAWSNYSHYRRVQRPSSEGDL